MASTNDIPLIGFALLGAQGGNRAMSSSTANPGELTGSDSVVMFNTGATPGTYTTRTAVQMIADGNLQNGQTWLIILANNQATGTLTLGGGSGVTVSGTTTCAPNVARFFIATVTSPTTIAIVGQALSFTCAA